PGWGIAYLRPILPRGWAVVHARQVYLHPAPRPPPACGATSADRKDAASDGTPRRSSWTALSAVLLRVPVRPRQGAAMTRPHHPVGGARRSGNRAARDDADAGTDRAQLGL